MTRIFDKIDQDLLSALRATPQVSKRANFCVSTFPLVAEPIKLAAQNARRDVAKGLIT